MNDTGLHNEANTHALHSWQIKARTLFWFLYGTPVPSPRQVPLSTILRIFSLADK